MTRWLVTLAAVGLPPAGAWAQQPVQGAPASPVAPATQPDSTAGTSAAKTSAAKAATVQPPTCDSMMAIVGHKVDSIRTATGKQDVELTAGQLPGGINPAAFARCIRAGDSAQHPAATAPVKPADSTASKPAP